jgi:hypothetical protein
MESMSAVEDVRKAIQDFLAPELRTIGARLDAIEKVMNVKFESVDVKLDALSQQIQTVNEKLDIDRRLTKLEARQSSATQ